MSSRILGWSGTLCFVNFPDEILAAEFSFLKVPTTFYFYFFFRIIIINELKSNFI